MIYVFKCTSCGYKNDYWYKSWRDLDEPPDCQCCGDEMQRVYTAPAIRPNGIKKAPPGTVEVGNEQPEPRQIDHMVGIEDKIYEAINTCDLDGSGDYELRNLN